MLGYAENFATLKLSKCKRLILSSSKLEGSYDKLGGVESD